ncbi:hypothetical protein GCM10027080_36070 [Pedococcus soli]
MELFAAQPGWQLEQGERVAARLAEQALGDVARDGVSATLVQELTGSSVVQPVDLQDWQPGRGELAAGCFTGSGGEHHGHRVRSKLSGGEQQRVRGRGVEPVRVIDHHEKRAFGFGNVGQNRQGCDANEERFDSWSVLETERDT